MLYKCLQKANMLYNKKKNKLKMFIYVIKTLEDTTINNIIIRIIVKVLFIIFKTLLTINYYFIICK